MGLPTTFVRLTGCPLRCHYCDTAYAFKGGQVMTLGDVVTRVVEYPTKYVTVTGGEPLAQPDCLPLMAQLLDRGFDVSLETSGALDIAAVPQKVMIVMDLKTPSSGEVDRNLWQNLSYLKKSDQIKFVIGDRHDYDWVKAVIVDNQLDDKCQLLVSPIWQQQSLSALAEWILSDGLSVRLQTQLHKVIWPGENKGR